MSLEASNATSSPTLRHGPGATLQGGRQRGDPGSIGVPGEGGSGELEACGQGFHDIHALVAIGTEIPTGPPSWTTRPAFILPRAPRDGEGWAPASLPPSSRRWWVGRAGGMSVPI